MIHELRRSLRVEFIGSENRKLAGILDQPAESPRGFILFSHCFTCNKDLKAIVRISRRLAEQGWGVLRYDFSGLGNSEGDFSKTNFSTNQIDLLSAASFLEKEYAPPSLLIGHSFGGAASLATAEKIPSVRGIVSLAAPSDTVHLADLLEKMDPSIKSGRGEVNIGGRSYFIDKQMVDDFRSHDLPAIIAKLTKPVLIIHSPIDETVGYHHAMRIFSLVSNRNDHQPASPGASLITLPASDHLLLNHSADLPFVSDTIDRWLIRLLHSRNEDHR